MTSHARLMRTTLLLLAAAGCDEEADPSDAGPAYEALVGEVEDSDIRVGALSDGARLRVFLCGGPSSYDSATHWLRAEIDDDGSFHATNDVLELTGSLVDGVLEAERVIGDERWAVRAERVQADTLAGLYEAKAECGTVGLIVAQDEPDAEPIAQGACVGEGHLPDQVNPIKPISRDRSGAIEVEVVRGDEATTEVVVPASL